MNKVIEKIINAEPNTFVLFISPECPYSMQAVRWLKTTNSKFKAYDVKDVGGMQKILEILNENVDLLKFNPKHRTKPIIFYNKEFIGGYDDLRSKFIY